MGPARGNSRTQEIGKGRSKGGEGRAIQKEDE